MFSLETIMKAIKLVENNQNDEAINLIENYLITANDDEKFTVADLYMQWGYLKEASVILQELLQKYPTEGELKVLLADIYIELENDEKAIDLLNDINEDDPAYSQSLLQLADLYQAQGLFEVTELKLLEAKQLNPDEEIIDLALGEFFFSIGEFNKAIIYYERVLPKTNFLANVSIFNRLAEAYASIGEYERALNYFEQVKNKDVETLFKQGFTAYQANLPDRAIQTWEKIIQQDPDYHPVYNHLVQAYKEQGLLKKAFEMSKQGLGVDEFNKELYYNAALLAHQLGDETESIRLVREAVVLDPDYKEAILFLVELFKAQENNEETIVLLNDIKQMGATDPLYEWELALAYEAIEAYDDALKHYKEAYVGLRHDSDFLIQYAYFLTEEGLTEKAIPVFKSYLAIDPSDSETEQFLNRLTKS